MTDPDAQVYPYIVGALPPEEVVEFEAHLVECAKCRAEVAELREVTAQLSEAVATEPPPALRAAVLAAVARTPRPPSSDQQATSDDGSTASPPGRHREAAPEPTGATVVPLHRSWAGRLPALLAAAAVVAALAVGGWAVEARQDAQRAADQASASTERLAELLTASDVRVVSGPVATTDGGTASVVMSSSRKQAVIVSTALPELPEGKVYEAWTIDRQPVPAGIFSAGEAKSAVSLPPEAFAAKTVAVTVEPAGGSQAPTDEPIFAVSMP